MARLSDLKLKYRLYMQVYPYRHLDWRPGAHLRKPLSESKVAVVTSAAFDGEGQEPFEPKIKGGDYSYASWERSRSVTRVAGSLWYPVRRCKNLE